jgi:hypothetical protein
VFSVSNQSRQGIRGWRGRLSGWVKAVDLTQGAAGRGAQLPPGVWGGLPLPWQGYGSGSTPAHPDVVNCDGDVRSGSRPDPSPGVSPGHFIIGERPGTTRERCDEFAQGEVMAFDISRFHLAGVAKRLQGFPIGESEPSRMKDLRSVSL